MKNLLFTLLLAALFLSSSTLFAQYSDGKKTGSISVGLGGGGLSGTGAVPISAEFNFLNYEKNIHVGLFVAYSSTSQDYNYNYDGKWSYTYIVIAAQGNWHFTPGEKFDPFAGVSLGYRIGTVSWSWNGPAGPYEPSSVSASDIFVSAQAGFNYWFNEKYAIQVRVGYFPYASVGFTMAF